MARIRRSARKPVSVRSRTRRRGLREFAYGVFRFSIYGIFGVALEIAFYNLVRNLRGVPIVGWLFQFDWRVDPSLHLDQVWHVPNVSLFGQCSLWMFPVYAVASFAIEFLYRNLPDVWWGLRSLAYGLVIFVWECLSGWLLLALTGYRIWYYADPANFFEMTSWRILPIWCITGLFVEYLYRQLMDPELVEAIETASLEPGKNPPVTGA